MTIKRLTKSIQRLSPEDRAEFNAAGTNYNGVVALFLAAISSLLLGGSILAGHLSVRSGAEGSAEFRVLLPFHLACISLTVAVFIVMLILRKKQLFRHIITDVLSAALVCLLITLFTVNAHVEINASGIKNVNTFIITLFALGFFLRFRIAVTLTLQALLTAVVIAFIAIERSSISNYYPSMINMICSFVISSLASFIYWNSRRRHFITTKRLQFLATSDSLTRLQNRRSFDIFFEREWLRAGNENLYIILYFIDVDHFKKYNDLYGHVQGDMCLCLVADTLANAVRKNDFVARYGGEEFVACLISENIEIAGRIADNMLDALRARNIPHGDSVVSHVSMSIGCMIHRPGDPGDLSMDGFLKKADDALYMAKNQGRNRVVFHPDAIKLLSGSAVVTGQGGIK